MGKYTTAHDRQQAIELIEAFAEIRRKMSRDDPQYDAVVALQENTQKRLVRIEDDLAKQEDRGSGL